MYSKTVVAILFILSLPLMQVDDTFALYNYEAQVTTWNPSGVGVNWDRSGSDRICYNQPGADGYYNVHKANPDGSNDVCLTCDKWFVPSTHKGDCDWYPVNGQYILFLAEKASHSGSSYEALPGFGAYNDIWIIKTDGTQAWQLTDISATDGNQAQIYARFSADGNRIIWSYRYQHGDIFDSDAHNDFGWWQIKVADLVWTNGDPSLQNIRTFEPQQAFYEPYGTTPDSRRIIFASSMNTGPNGVWDLQVFSMDADTFGDIRQLTSKTPAQQYSYKTNVYNEQTFQTPDGTKLVRMTDLQSTWNGTDWWIMDADGSNSQRLTYFNEWWHPQFEGSRWAVWGSFNAGGTQFIGGVVTDLISQAGEIKMVTLVKHPAGSGTGLKGEYFNNTRLRGAPILTRVDKYMDFDWGQGSPDPRLSVDSFAVRWTGKVQPYYTEPYTFYTITDGGVRLWVNNQLIINSSYDSFPIQQSRTILLTGGVQYDIKMEYYERGAGAVAKLAWSSPKHGKEIIPFTQLYPAR